MAKWHEQYEEEASDVNSELVLLTLNFQALPLLSDWNIDKVNSGS